jgi:hypothetical protein
MDRDSKDQAMLGNCSPFWLDHAIWPGCKKQYRWLGARWWRVLNSDSVKKDWLYLIVGKDVPVSWGVFASCPSMIISSAPVTLKCPCLDDKHIWPCSPQGSVGSTKVSQWEMIRLISGRSVHGGAWRQVMRRPLVWQLRPEPEKLQWCLKGDNGYERD